MKMRLIDASELIQVLCVNMDSGEQFDKATHCVDAMPTVDAVPVIRCRECKHVYTFEDGQQVCVMTPYDSFPNRHFRADGYCHMAERKEE